MNRQNMIYQDARRKGKKYGMKSIKRLLPFLRPYIPLIILAVAMAASVSAISMLIPKATGMIIDSATEEGNLKKLNMIAVGLIMLIGITSIMQFYSSYWLNSTGARFLKEMRENLFNHILGQSHSFFLQRQTGEINSRITSNLDLIQDIIVLRLARGIQSLATLIGVAILLFFISAKLTALIIMLTIPIIAISFLYSDKLEAAAMEKSDSLAQASANVEEVLSGINTVQSFNAEKSEAKRYKSLLDNLLARQLRHTRLQSSYISLLGFFGLSAVVIVFLVGGHLIQSGAITVGDLTASMMYMLMFADSIENVGSLFNDIKELSGVSHRVFELLDEKPKVENKGTIIANKADPINIKVDNISFGHKSDSRPIIDSLSFELSEGEQMALIGPSGAGKTTLLKLLLRFYDVDSGCIYVNGQRIENYELSALRSMVGIVSQEVFLFSGSVLDNLRYGAANASIDEVNSALDAVGATEFVNELEHGLNEKIGVGGMKLSGGQKQRLAIARAYLKNPKILLLDEATSSLDSESERKVQAGLSELRKGRTTIVISHRLSSIKNIDKIYVMQNGSLSDMGDHQNLKKRSALYNQYWQWQSQEAVDKTQVSD